MDALKKAELEKRRNVPGEDPSGGASGEKPSPLALAPLDAPPDKGPSSAAIDDRGSSPENLPKLPERLEDLDEQFALHLRKEPAKSGAGRTATAPAPKSAIGLAIEPQESTSPKPAPAPPPAAAQPAPAAPKPDPQAARNVFAAKSGEADGGRKVFALAVGGLTLVALLGIGAYFWWQLQPKSSLTPLRPAGNPTVPPPATPPSTNPTAAVTPSIPAAPPPAAATPSAPASTVTPTPALAESTLRPEPPPRRRTAEAPEPAAESPVRLTRAPLRLNPGLGRAYELFERGELATARREYEAVLKGEPQNRDALYGLAAIALRDNRPDQADGYYQRMLVADPQDPDAIAGLANLRGRSNPLAAESRLKAVSAENPEAAAPLVALGNLYSSQERWHDAQNAYFKAYALEPGNPDLLFNLAVSLEHIRQPRLAAQYYGLAIQAAGSRAASFDAALAAQRLKALQTSPPVSP